MKSHTSMAHPADLFLPESVRLQGTPSSLVAKENGKKECLFLEGHSCSIHESKPLLCRLYPFFPIPSAVIERTIGPVADAVKVKSERNGSSYYITYDEKCPGTRKLPRVDWQRILRIWEQYEDEVATDD